MNTILPRVFYEDETTKVAQQLLGKYLVRILDGEMLVGKVIETEAYLPFDDPASHNFIGKTVRNAVLFEMAGFTYVHSIRQYHCMDIVTETVDVPGSVLLRAVIPVEGIEIMKELRKTEVVENLASGPGKLCQAFAITRKENGIDVTDPNSEIFVASEDDLFDESLIEISKRIGITKAADLLLRFRLKEFIR